MADKKITAWNQIMVTPCYIENGKTVKLTDQTLPVEKEEVKGDADVILTRADCKFTFSFMFTRYENNSMYLRSIDPSGTNQIILKMDETTETPKVHLNEDGKEKDVYFEFLLK